MSNIVNKYYELWSVKDCPYCGSSAIAFYDQSVVCGKPTFNIKCKYCGYIVTSDDEKDVINKWNEAKYD